MSHSLPQRAEYDVVVVGARCAGSPTAMLLARQGHSVLLLDRDRFPSDTLSTHWVVRPGVERLASWGLLDALIQTGCPPLRQITLNFGDTMLSGIPGRAEDPAVTYAPRRTVLDHLLAEAADGAGAEVIQGAAVRAVLREEGTVHGVTGQVAPGNPFSVRARVVVGADGRNSTMARAVGARMIHDRGPLAATAYGYWEALPVDGVEAYFNVGAGLSLWPTHHGHTVVALTVRRERLFGWGQDRTTGYLQQLEAFPAVASRLGTARLVGSARCATNLRNFYRQSHGPGWALAGDAGHHKDPIAARGISDAFADAESLATAIHDGLTGCLPMQRSLARYEARRNTRTAAMFEFTCHQAALQGTDPRFDRLLPSAETNSRARERLLGVFAGAGRITDLSCASSLPGGNP